MEFLLSKLCFSFSFSKKKTCFSFLYEIATVNQWMGEVVRIGFFLVMWVTTWWRPLWKRVGVCSIALTLTSTYTIRYWNTSLPSFSAHAWDGRPWPNVETEEDYSAPDLRQPVDRIGFCRPRIHFLRFSDRSLCSWHLAPKRGCWTGSLLLFWRVAATSKRDASVDWFICCCSPSRLYIISIIMTKSFLLFHGDIINKVQWNKLAADRSSGATGKALQYRFSWLIISYLSAPADVHPQSHYSIPFDPVSTVTYVSDKAQCISHSHVNVRSALLA